MDKGTENYRRFLTGDENGLEEIVKEYKDGLILYLNSFIKNIHISEELMEDTFVKLVIKKPKLDENRAFKTWLYKVARNLAIDYLRKNSRMKKSDVSDEELTAIVADKEDLEQNYIRKEEKILLHKSISNLSENYRQVLYLSYFENFSNKETAEIMKKNKRQVENLIYRAKLSLKAELEKEGFTYEGL